MIYNGSIILNTISKVSFDYIYTVVFSKKISIKVLKVLQSEVNISNEFYAELKANDFLYCILFDDLRYTFFLIFSSKVVLRVVAKTCQSRNIYSAL